MNEQVKMTPEQEEYNRKFVEQHNATLRNRVNGLTEEVLQLETHLRVANARIQELQQIMAQNQEAAKVPSDDGAAQSSTGKK